MRDDSAAIRARLAVTLVALVALTAILLGAGAYVFVETAFTTRSCAMPRHRRASTWR